MKKLIKVTCLFIVLVLANQVYAQTSKLGVRAGVNVATMSENPFEYASTEMEKDYTVGANVALFLNLPVTHTFSIQPELQWIQKGIQSEMTSADDMEVKMVYRTNYFEIPVLARVDIAAAEVVSFNVFLGPSIGYATTKKYIGKNAKLGTEDPIEKGDFKENVEWDDEYGANGTVDNRWDFSAVAGVGLTIDAIFGDFVIDARYNMDFNDAVTYEKDPSPYPDKFTNRGISVTAGVAFPF